MAPLAAARLTTLFLPHGLLSAPRGPWSKMKSPMYWQLSSPVPSDSCTRAPSGVSVALVSRWTRAATRLRRSHAPRFRVNADGPRRRDHADLLARRADDLDSGDAAVLADRLMLDAITASTRDWRRDYLLTTHRALRREDRPRRSIDRGCKSCGRGSGRAGDSASHVPRASMRD